MCLNLGLSLRLPCRSHDGTRLRQANFDLLLIRSSWELNPRIIIHERIFTSQLDRTQQPRPRSCRCPSSLARSLDNGRRNRASQRPRVVRLKQRLEAPRGIREVRFAQRRLRDPILFELCPIRDGHWATLSEQSPRRWRGHAAQLTRALKFQRRIFVLKSEVD